MQDIGAKNGTLSRLTPDRIKKMIVVTKEESRKKVTIPPPSIYRCCLGNLKHLGQFVRHRPDRHKGSICLTSIGPGTIVKPVPVRYEQSCFAGFLCFPVRYEHINTECRQSSYAHNEKEGQSPFARRESHACNITMKGKWDVLGSPSKPWQTRSTTFLSQIWRKRANHNMFMPKNYTKKFCHVGLYIAKKIFSRESYEFFMKFYEKLCQFGLYIAKGKKELTKHFRMSYVPSPHANQYREDTVAHFQGIKIFHMLNVEKIIPSFNIGILLALFHCLLLIFCCQKSKNAGESAIRKRYVQRGEYLLRAIHFMQQKYYDVLKKSLTKREMSTKSTYSHKKKGETSASTPHALQNKVGHTHVYNLKKFFNSCVKGNVEGPEGAATLTSTLTPLSLTPLTPVTPLTPLTPLSLTPLTPQTQLTPLSLTPQTQLTPLSLTPQTQLTPLSLTPQTQLTPLSLTPQTQLTPLSPLTPQTQLNPSDPAEGNGRK